MMISQFIYYQHFAESSLQARECLLRKTELTYCKVPYIKQEYNQHMMEWTSAIPFRVILHRHLLQEMVPMWSCYSGWT